MADFKKNGGFFFINTKWELETTPFCKSCHFEGGASAMWAGLTRWVTDVTFGVRER